MPPNSRNNAYDASRERLLKKLHARQPPSSQHKFIVGDNADTLPLELKSTVKDVLGLKYPNGMAAYPECKFRSIDVLWCKPPNSAAVPDGVVPWNRTRFYIEYRRTYGAFTVDFLQSESLPKDFSDVESDLHEAACTIDITFRKIAMEFSCSNNEHHGAGRGNNRSNYYKAIHALVQGWVSIDGFAAGVAAFRTTSVKRCQSLITIQPAEENNLTRPLVFLKVNADSIESVVQAAADPQLQTMIIIVPEDGKPMRMVHTFEERESAESR